MTTAPQHIQKDTMELLEEDLTCPICCCLFEDPRVLPCSHSFCKKCLEGILDGNRSPAWRPPFKCPTCRKETVHNGIASLQVNYSLRGIVEKYNKIRVLPKMSLCRAHSGQPLNIFCATDLKLICGFCATTGVHKGHKFCALEEAYDREKAAFEELFRVVEGWRGAEVHSCLESLEGAKKKALERVSRDADRVSEYFDKLLRALEHKRSEILSDFETLKLAVMQTFDPEINRLRSALEEQRRALNIAESFRSLSDPLTFLQQMQDFRENLRVLRGTPLPSRTDMDVGLLGLQNFDVKEWDRFRLGEVDKLCAPYESNACLAPPPPAAPRFSRMMWRVLLVVCACLPALNFLPSDCISLSFHEKVMTLGGFSLPGHGEILRWLGFCWKEAAAICTLLTEMCRNCILEMINTTSDFIS
ncbi:tripartite motif-containing 13 [Xyrauchen texanus]|uniref:tripartite motif-containing 13 n=1 Tax=Xyrauchen texanus TaxID=154827 RepID=UPI0022424A99|nr:tripartite motif-containing 13 [Xyrauchen texanus]XP_052004175.1 tripartite motif-containing 13 [Xyrauchen texanus]